MDVLVIGSAGFAGRELVPRLKAAGHRVIGIDIESEDQSDVFIQHDLTSPLSLASFCPDICIHLASAVGGFIFNSEQRDLIEQNKLINANTIAACVDAGCKHIIFFSSINVFEHNPLYTHGPLEMMRQSSPYAILKAEGEQQMVNSFEHVIIIRPTNLFGRRQVRRHDHYGESHVIPDILKKIDIEPELEIFGDGSQIRNFVHVGDVCDFVVQNMSWEGHLYFNLRSNITITIEELAKQLLQMCGKDMPIRFRHEYMRYELLRITNFDLSLPVAYGWEPTTQTIADGLKR